MDEVKVEILIQGLDFEEKLIVAIDERLVFEQPGVGINEQTVGEVRGVESKGQRELLRCSRVTSQIDYHEMPENSTSFLRKSSPLSDI